MCSREYTNLQSFPKNYVVRLRVEGDRHCAVSLERRRSDVVTKGCDDGGSQESEVGVRHSPPITNVKRLYQIIRNSSSEC